MTEEEEGLPTAAVGHWDMVEGDYASFCMPDGDFAEIWKEKDPEAYHELVRRKDVEALIDDLGLTQDEMTREIVECPDCTNTISRIFETRLSVCNDHVHQRERLVERKSIIEELLEDVKASDE